jgi:putative transposase
MLVHQAFRYELAPTPTQRAALANHAGAARWAWNWGLSMRRNGWQRRRERLGAVELHRLLNRLKRTPRYGWLYEVSKCAPQEALRDLDRAYANYWHGRKGGRRVGFPRWKKRGRCPERFRLTGAIHVRQDAIVLPRIGRVATREPTGKLAKWDGRVLSATCRREADRWYCSLTVQVQRPDPAPVNGPVVRVDRGISTFAVCSDGSRIHSPRALERSLRRVRRRGRAVSRKQPGSRNRAKAELPLGARIFRCQGCGLVLDRDLNAAKNLAQLVGDSGVAMWVAGSSPETENACGACGAGQTGNGLVEPPAGKQERARIHGHTPMNA